MKKKFVCFIFAFALIFAGAMCLTACSSDHVDFDMFEKEYVIGSNRVGSILYNGESEDNRQTLTDWEQWLKDNETNLKDSSGNNIVAQDVIDAINANNFISNATVKVTGLGQSEGYKTGTVEVKGGSLTAMTLDFKAQESTSYPGNYSYGNFTEPNSGHLGLTVSWDAKVKGIDINFSYEPSSYANYSNYSKNTLFLNGRELELRVGYDLLNWNNV